LLFVFHILRLLAFFYSPNQRSVVGVIIILTMTGTPAKMSEMRGRFPRKKSLNRVFEVAGLLQKKFSALSVALLQKKLQKKYTFSLYRLIVIHM
jgi:hypothetical protein